MILLNDLHIGCRNNNPIFYDQLDKLFDQVFEYIKSNNVKHVCVLGDTFDNRNSISLLSLNFAVEKFTKLSKMVDKIDVILGNHDIMYQNTLHINSPKPVLGNIPKVNIIDECKEFDYGNVNVLYVPWITNSKETENIKTISESNADICFGHFDIIGFNFNKHTVNMKHGLDPKVFRKFRNVYSGHYHLKSKQQNITYLGTQYQWTWDDLNEAKGFHVLDENGNVEFIENPNQIFREFQVSDNKLVDDISEINLTNAFVRVKVKGKNTTKGLNKVVEKIVSLGAKDVKIIEEYTNKSSVDVGENIENALSENTNIKDAINDIVDDIDVNNENIDEQKIKILLKDITDEAYQKTLEDA